MTEKELCKQLNVSRRTLCNFRLGYSCKKKDKVYSYPSILTEGEDWNITLVKNRTVVIYTEKGINKIQFTLTK